MLTLIQTNSTAAALDDLIERALAATDLFAPVSFINDERYAPSLSH